MAILSNQFLQYVELERENVADFKSYPFCIPVINKMTRINFHEAVTFIVGENGSGKSTLLEAIAVGLDLNPEGGSRNFNFSSYASHSNLFDYLKIIKGYSRPRDMYFFRAETFYNVATNIEELDKDPFGPPILDSYGGQSLHQQSHGESLFSLISNRLRGQSLYILDEPEAALSPSRQLAFIARLHELVERGSQFVIATHSPIIMAYPNAKIIQIKNDKIEEIKYCDSEHYAVMKHFMNNHEQILNILMSDAPDNSSTELF